jgi:hypothetical protein
MSPEGLKPALKEKFKDVAVWTLVVAALGVIAPIVWDRYQNASQLTLTEKDSTAIISFANVPQDLTVTYGGAKIQNLTRIGFELANTGSKPIQSEQLVGRPQIIFGNSARILSASVDGASPPGVAVSLKTMPDKDALGIDFPLLNVGDKVEFSLLVDQASPVYLTSARIVGIHALTFERLPHRAKLNLGSLSWGAYVVILTTLLCLILILGGWAVYLEERRTVQRWKLGRIFFPRSVTPGEFRMYLDLITQKLKRYDDMGAARRLLTTLPEGQAVAEAESERLRAAIGASLANLNFPRVMMVIVALLTVIGAWYSVHVLLRAME